MDKLKRKGDLTYGKHIIKSMSYMKKNLNNIVRLCKTCKTIHINIINVSSYVLHFQKRGKMGPPWGDFLKKKVVSHPSSPHLA